MRSAPVYRSILGSDFDALSATLRAMHEGKGPRRACGRARVVRSNHPLGSLIARCMSFPPSCDDSEIAVDLVPEGSGERWIREFGGHRFSSRIRAENGYLVETFWPASLCFRLDATAREISWRFIGMKVLGLPWPGLLAPRVVARERDVGEYQFEVSVALPLIGTLVEYEGTLRLASPRENEPSIVVFDGVCVLCSGWVRFLLRRDRRGELRFAAVQSVSGAALLERHGESASDPQTLLLIEQGRCYKQTDAIRRILAKLSLRWRVVGFAIGLVPKGLRDWMYLRIARNRYGLFGLRETCLMPDAAVKERFLE